jgi:putative flippase GtrA
MIFTNSLERTRFLKFAFVGVMGAVVDFGVFNLLTGAFKFEATPSSVVSFLLAVVSNFIWNRYWTYPDSRSKALSRQVFQFIIVSLIGLAIRTPLFAFLEKLLVSLAGQYLPNAPLSPTFIGHNVSLATAIIVVMMWNFVANRYWTYNDVSKQPEGN